jgi:NitT/TauT family transport system permease protein
VVAELPSGARAGLGARLLVFSYRSETIPMWANLVSAAILAGLLVVSFGMLERALNRRLGFRTAGEVSS